MTEQRARSVHCVRDIREFPLEAYRLPKEGREWRHVARNRQSLANWLATYADGDGTRVYPSVKTMSEHFDWSRGTIFRLLADLRALRLLNDKSGLHGERGTAIRSLDVDAFSAGAGVSNPEQESQTHASQDSQTREQESQTQKPKSQIREQESHVGRDTTVRCTDTPTIHPTVLASSFSELAGWEGWILLPTTTDLMGIPSDNEQGELKALASKEPHGFEYLKKAVRKFRDRDQGFSGLTKVSPWRLFLQQSVTAMAIAKQECLDSGDWRMKHDPVYRAQQEASIARQTAEHKAQWQKLPKCSEESIEDFLEEQ